MQPASISENSLRSLAACINCKAQATIATIPVGRAGSPADVARAAVYLASAAGSFMTGQMMVVDGGATVN